MCRRFLVGLLALGLLLGQFSAYSAPSPSSPGVYLSQAEYDQIVAEVESAKESLKKSNELIAKQSKDLTTLWIFSGALATALVLEGIAAIITAVKH